MEEGIKRERMEEELEKIKERIKKLNEEKELGDKSEEEYNEKVCEYFCNAAESSSLSSLLFLSSLLPSQLFLNYRSTKRGEKGWNAILYASKGGSIEVMEFLLSFGFNINFFGTKRSEPCVTNYEENCLFIAIENGKSKEYIEYLYSQNAHIVVYNDREEGLLHCAIKANNIEVIEYLISLRLDLNWITYEGYTLFLYAVRYSNLKVIQYLVSLNLFDIHSRLPIGDYGIYEVTGWNAIIIAALYNSLEVLQYFVSLGVDIQCTDKKYEKNAFYLCALQFTREDTKERERTQNNMKYLMSIGIDTYQNKNNMIFQREIISYILQKGDLEHIKFIFSLYRSKRVFVRENLESFCESNYLFDTNTLKYLIENKLIAETFPKKNPPHHGTILHCLINSLIQLSSYNLYLKSTEEKFKRFKECFDYFLERGNDINSTIITPKNIPFQLIKYDYIANKLLWMIIKYLIDKGTNLLFKTGNGSVLHSIKNSFTRNNKQKEEIMKYIIIRSDEINEKSSAQRSMIQYIQHSTIQNNNNKDLLFINNNNNNNNEKEMKSKWKRVFSSFVLSPFILSFTNEENQKFIINENGELNLI